jgi:organic radical activating enzyme
MSKELVSIRPVQYFYRVEINPGNICNYKCPYCIEKSNMGPDCKWLEWKYLKAFCEDIIERNKDRDILFSLCNGGEPTMYPHIDDLLDLLKDHTILVGSNGSRSIGWWSKHLDKIDDLAISCHYTQINKDEFLKKIKYISERKTISVIFPLYSTTFWDQYKYAEQIINECDNVFISFKTLVSKPFEQEYEYEKGQKEYFIEHPFFKSEKYDENKKTRIDISCIKTYSDGSEERDRPQLMIANNEHRFKGWKCWAGLDFLRLDYEGNILRCSFYQGENKITGKYEIPTEPVLCPRKTCGCVPAISIRKQKYE